MTSSDKPKVDLFTPIKVEPLVLPNRIVMAPMTRNRTGPGDVPRKLNITYYAQRASAGLPERFARNAPLNVPDTATFFGGDEHGYTDSPFPDTQ
jgi:NADH:flavin oxidoreductase / NADH oxidase family